MSEYRFIPYFVRFKDKYHDLMESLKGAHPTNVESHISQLDEFNREVVSIVVELYAQSSLPRDKSPGDLTGFIIEQYGPRFKELGSYSSTVSQYNELRGKYNQFIEIEKQVDKAATKDIYKSYLSRLGNGAIVCFLIIVTAIIARWLDLTIPLLRVVG